MAKKNLKYFIPGAIALVLGIVAFCMMFLPAITFNAGDSSSDGWTGAQIAFGYKESFLGQEITVLNFNFLVFLAFLLPLVGGVLALLFKNGLITKIVTTACFVVGAVLLFSIVGLSGIGRVSLEEGNIINEAVNAALSSAQSSPSSARSRASSKEPSQNCSNNRIRFAKNGAARKFPRRFFMPVYPFPFCQNAVPFRAAPAAAPQMRAGVLLRSLCSRAEWRGNSEQKKRRTYSVRRPVCSVKNAFSCPRKPFSAGAPSTSPRQRFRRR